MRQAKQAHEDLEAYKARADYYRDRMAGGDALSEDDLKDMKADLDAMPEELYAEFTSQGHERGAGEAAGPDSPPARERPGGGPSPSARQTWTISCRPNRPPNRCGRIFLRLNARTKSLLHM